jgi:hypothetical protein
MITEVQNTTSSQHDAKLPVVGSASRFNIYSQGKLIGQDYLSSNGRWMHKWILRGEFERGGWPGKANGIGKEKWSYVAVPE